MQRLEILTIGDPAMPIDDRVAITRSFIRSTHDELGDGIPGRYWTRHQQRVDRTTRNWEDVILQNILDEADYIASALAFASVSVAPCES